MELFINKKIWKTFTENQMDEYVELVFQYYKNKGFPYYPTNHEYRQKEFEKLKITNLDLLHGDTISQSMLGLALASSYFPNIFNIVCGENKTPLSVFEDDQIFRKVICKRIKMGDNMSDAGIRKMLRMFSGVQSASNFRPTAGAAIYNVFAKDGVVWDMSSGFGGRLFGAIVSDIKKYIGTEPSTETYNGLLEIKKDFGNKPIEIHKLGSEVFIPDTETLDFCFTSPPYFNWEKYSNEDSQSYKKFTTREDWVDGFLKRTFYNCYQGLKPNKFMAINICNVKNFKDLESETIKAAKEVGFNYVDTLKLTLSHMKKEFKYEPIFIFKK